MYKHEVKFYKLHFCCRTSHRLIQHSSCLQELDIDDNLIGDLGGREIMEALNQRKEAGHPSMKMSVTHRMNSETFASIMKLGAGLKKKGKKKGKKKVGWHLKIKGSRFLDFI